MKRMGIYAITHTASGRVYIGSTSHVTARFRQHQTLLKTGKHPNVYLQRSWDRHGADAFTFRVIEEVENAAGLLEREQFHIDTLDSACHAKGFNLSPMAGSARGCVRSPETRALLSERHRGRRHTLEACRKISQAQRGKKRSVEQRKNMSAAQQRPAQRAKMSAVRKAFELTPRGRYQRKRLAAMAATRVWTPEQRDAIRVRNTGRKASDSAREAMRAGSRRFWDSPAGKERRAEHSKWFVDQRAKRARV